MPKKSWGGLPAARNRPTANTPRRYKEDDFQKRLLANYSIQKAAESSYTEKKECRKGSPKKETTHGHLSEYATSQHEVKFYSQL